MESVYGCDDVVILFVLYLGVEFCFVVKGVFGGELFWVMLVIEVVIVVIDLVFMFVFDEVDVGIGGVVVIEVGW